MGKWKDGQCHLGAQEQESFIESWPNGQTLCILWGGGWTWVITPHNFGFVWCFMLYHPYTKCFLKIACSVAANDICFQDATGVFQGYYFSGVPTTQPHHIAVTSGPLPNNPTRKLFLSVSIFAFFLCYRASNSKAWAEKCVIIPSAVC